MLFAHDTEESLRSAAALVNTGGDPDTLATVADLDAFVRSWGFTGRHDHDEAELRAVQDLRVTLRHLWTADDLARVHGVNALLRDAAALPQLVRHDGWGWHLHATGPDDPLAVRMAVEAAMALIDVIRSEETLRLRTCEAPGCGDVLIDLSRNRSRRFCSVACGNRVAAAAYRARRTGA